MKNLRLLEFSVEKNNQKYQIFLQLTKDKFSQNNIIESFQANMFFENSLSLFLIRALKAGDVFYDIGAHVGYFSILSSFLVGHSGRVIAIEPEIENCNQLENHIKLNKRTNIKLIKGVISDVDGRLDFYRNLDNDGGHSLFDISEHPMNSKSKANPLKIKTNSFTLDSLIKKSDMPLPRIIKVDVEGAELQVIQGGGKIISPENIDFIICEWNIGSHISSLKLRREMLSKGYQTFVFDDKNRFPKFIPPNLDLKSEYVFNVLFSSIQKVSELWKKTDVYIDGMK